MSTTNGLDQRERPETHPDAAHVTAYLLHALQHYWDDGDYWNEQISLAAARLIDEANPGNGIALATSTELENGPVWHLTLTRHETTPADEGISAASASGEASTRRDAILRSATIYTRDHYLAALAAAYSQQDDESESAVIIADHAADYAASVTTRYPYNVNEYSPSPDEERDIANAARYLASTTRNNPAGWPHPYGPDAYEHAAAAARLGFLTPEEHAAAKEQILAETGEQDPNAPQPEPEPTPDDDAAEQTAADAIAAAWIARRKEELADADRRLAQLAREIVHGSVPHDEEHSTRLLTYAAERNAAAAQLDATTRNLGI